MGKSTKQSYDVIVVGARCAGSPLAMLLAQKGHRVLVVDRSTFPSDTVSTHLVHTPGVASLDRWGLLADVVATGAPPITTYQFDFGPVVISGSPATPQAGASYCPRRTVLDEILVRAADRAGAEVREGFTVEEIVFENGTVTGIRGHGRDGRTITERAAIVVGADGRNSTVVKATRPERYHERPPLQGSYYSYWSGVDVDRVEVYDRHLRGFAAFPTNDGLTMIVAGWPTADFRSRKTDVERSVQESIDLAPEFAERVRAGKREERFIGAAVANYYRKPFGPGWVLVGDAGYNKDPITGQGISDAFWDAEVVSEGLHDVLSGTRGFDETLAAYQAARDARSLAMYEFTCNLATMEPPPAELQQLFGAVSQSQESMDGFARLFAGATSPAEFFSEENIAAILSRAGAPVPA